MGRKTAVSAVVVAIANVVVDVVKWNGTRGMVCCLNGNEFNNNVYIDGGILENR